MPFGAFFRKDSVSHRNLIDLPVRQGAPQLGQDEKRPHKSVQGALLNLGAGMRMGWITGVLAFALYIVPFALQLPRMSSLMEERLRAMRPQDPAIVEQMMGLFQTGPGMALVVAFTLAAMFLIITFLSIAGGALGAKVVGRH